MKRADFAPCAIRSRTVTLADSNRAAQPWWIPGIPADCYVLPVKLRETFARCCLFQPTICRRSDSPCPENPNAYLQNQQPCGRQKDRTMNMKTDLRLSLYSRNPVSVNECYGNRHFFFSRPAGGTLSFLCAEGAAPQFFQGTCSIFSRPMLQAYPLFFSVGMNYVTILL
jgi:hypothetical protein